MLTPRNAPGREPAINLPGPVAAAIVALMAIHALRQALSDSTDLGLLVDFAFVPAQWSIGWGYASADEVLRAAGQGGDADVVALREALARFFTSRGEWRPWSCLTYALLHGSWIHVGLNCVWLAAFGAPVVARAGVVRASLLAVATALGGAGAQWLSDPLAVQPMIGASAIVSGFMAAAATFIFAGPGGRSGATEPGWGFLTNRNVLVFLGLWFAANVVFGLLATPLGVTEGSIAWQAHIGGLVVGLALFPLLDPTRSASTARGA